MSIDMSQFLQTFYEESFEGLEIMETELMNLEPGATDLEVINTIFRAAHSIKGGSATFGLTDLASFTHVLETLLDEMRDGSREVTEEAVDLLLKSVDCLREMLSACRDETEVDQANIDLVHDQLEAMLQGNDNAKSAETSQGDSINTGAEQTPAIHGWHIDFRPLPHLFKTGNDPVRLFRELQDMGEFTVQMDDTGLPALQDMDPEDSYLAWSLDLRGDIERSVIEEVFAWVDGDCELSITPIYEQGATSSTATEQGAEQETDEDVKGPTLVAPADERRVGDRRAGDRRKGERRAASAGGEGTSIRVGIDKVDSVINLVGELVITQSMLSTLGEDFNMEKISSLVEGLDQLELNTRELQEQVMRMRMMPISFSFNRLPRMVHDLSKQLDKKIDLQITGEGTELDKTVMEKIGDPLVHLVRNSLDHGIETPADRIAAGKPETGNLWVKAYHQGGNIIIEVEDDGKGLDSDKIYAKAVERGLVPADSKIEQEKIYELIMLPGFSTADVVTDVSGRGVGMDVVVKNIQSLNGSIEVTSAPGKGSKFTIRLPLTLAILDGQTIAVGSEDYIIPIVSIIESIQLTAEMLNAVVGKGETFKLRDEHLPIIRLHKVLGGQPRTTDLTKGLLVVVEGEGRKVGLFVDELKGQQQVVIKSLESNYQKVDGISGATILGDGSVALILDISGLIRLFSQEIDAASLQKIA